MRVKIKDKEWEVRESAVNPSDRYFIYAFDQGTHIGIAELTRFDDGEYNDDPYLWFNRLYVDPMYRQRGIADYFMQRVVDFARSANLPIVNTIIPYGDMNLHQLLRFFENFGFEQQESEDDLALVVFKP